MVELTRGTQYEQSSGHEPVLILNNFNKYSNYNEYKETLINFVFQKV